MNDNIYLSSKIVKNSYTYACCSRGHACVARHHSHCCIAMPKAFVYITIFFFTDKHMYLLNTVYMVIILRVNDKQSRNYVVIWINYERKGGGGKTVISMN